MSSALPCVLCVAALLAAAERPVRQVPVLAKAPRLDASAKDLSAGLALKKVEAAGATASLTARVATFKDALVIGAEIRDDNVGPGDVLDVLLQFPGAGATARGHAFRFAFDGQRSPEADVAAPVFAQRLVKVQVQRTAEGMSIEAAIPARALPRIPVKEPLTLELCLTYQDHDQVGAAPKSISNCTGGSMVGESLRLSNELRAGLKLKPPAEVEGIEGREHGWVGYAKLHYPAWTLADEPLTAESLRPLVAEEPVDPSSARMSVPEKLQVLGAGVVMPVLSGKDPYVSEGKCDPERELRFGFYLVEGKAARRVLEWPAATCSLGRATSVHLDDEEGALTIGYSNGATITFAWSNDRFERTEIGKR